MSKKVFDFKTSLTIKCLPIHLKKGTKDKYASHKVGNKE